MRAPRPDPGSPPERGRTTSVNRLAYGYAITVHRAQGTTVEVAHVLDNGGGRELA